MEVGECTGIGTSEEPPPGELQVKVVSKGKERAIEKADVTATVDRYGATAADGTVTFKKLCQSTYDVRVVRRYPDQDWIAFIRHYPAFTMSHEAISFGHESVLVAATASLTVKIDYYRRLPGVAVHRNHILWNAGPNEDKYGHWWIVIDDESYGWWPKDRFGPREPPPEPPAPPAADAGRAAHIQHMFASMIHRARLKLFNLRNSAPVQTLLGVQGELNAAEFGGTRTRDPHHGDRGHDVYELVVTDEEDDDDIKLNMRRFARAYSGSWSWRFEFGQNCHTFQIGLLAAAEVRRFRKI